MKIKHVAIIFLFAFCIAGCDIDQNAKAADINEILRVYLDTDSRGGYRSGIGIDQEARLRKAFPNMDIDDLMQRIDPYLEEWHNPDYEWEDLAAEADKFEELLVKKFPELDPLIARSLANRWSYSNR